MNRPRIRAGICAAVLTGAVALTGTAAMGSQASDERPGRGGYSASLYEDTNRGRNVPAVVTAWKAEVRDAPNPHAEVTSTLHKGAHLLLFCQTTGDYMHGTSLWYFDNYAHGWISASQVHPTGHQPPSC